MKAYSPNEDRVTKGLGAASTGETFGEPDDPVNTTKPGTNGLTRYARGFERTLIKYNLETRGLLRVEPHERDPESWKLYLQAFNLWFSVNLAAVNITLGMLAPAIFFLSFKDAALCAVFGSALGSLGVGYIATWGPMSGHRTLVIARYTFGWWPSKLLVILNLIVMLGYSLIDLVVAGQILRAVSTNQSLSLVVGIIIIAIITWVITTFGISLFHTYQRYAWFPQLIAICILYGVSASNFDLSTPSEGSTRTVIGSRISFFSLCFSAAITYAGEAADFFVYYPPTTSRFKLFISSFLGLLCSFTLAIIVGIGLASGVPSVPSYSSAYESGGQGGLLVEGLVKPLGDFGKFLAVVITLGLIANTVAPTYCAGIDFQILFSVPASHADRSHPLNWLSRIPRVVHNSIAVLIYTICALAGRDHLSEVFTNFLALMGYWLAIWIGITLEEHLLFRNPPWRKRNIDPDAQEDGIAPRGYAGYDWTAYDTLEGVSHGIAALIAFLVGWAGSILCMAQVWYIGPIARLVGDYGADVSFFPMILDQVIFCLWSSLLARTCAARSLCTSQVVSFAGRITLRTLIPFDNRFANEK